MQRTDLQNKIENKFFKKLNLVSKGASTIPYLLFQSLNYNKVLDRYMDEIEGERKLLQALMAKNLRENFVVLDIGCGIGGYHIDWLKELDGKQIQLFLMDSSNFDLASLKYGHGKSKRFYNSLELAKKMIISGSGVKSDLVHLVDVKRDFPGKLPQNIDLVVSFIAWGFHYHLEDYWNEIMSRLFSEKSMMLIDVRKDSPSSNFLSEQSNLNIKVISTNQKYDRFMITKKMGSL